MDFSQLQYFDTIVKTMNFTKAADEACISQSSLSKRIMALEAELDVCLFDRSQRQIQLTPAGEKFAEHVSVLIEGYKRLLGDMQDYRNQSRMTIKVTSIQVLMQYGILDGIISFRKKNPEIEVTLSENDLTLALEMLDSSSADLAIVREHSVPLGKRYRMHPLIDDEMVLVCRSDHRFAELKEIELADASAEEFAFLGSNTGLYEACLQECTRAGFAPRTSYLTVKISSVIQGIINQNMISLLVRKTVEPYLKTFPNVKIIPLKMAPRYPLVILAKENRNLSPACRHFISYLADYCNCNDAHKA